MDKQDISIDNESFNQSCEFNEKLKDPMHEKVYKKYLDIEVDEKNKSHQRIIVDFIRDSRLEYERSLNNSDIQMEGYEIYEKMCVKPYLLMYKLNLYKA